MDLFNSFQLLPYQKIQGSIPFKHTQSSAEGSQIQNENQEPTKLEAACTEFESLFIFYMLKEMRNTVNKSGYLDGGKAEELYTSMMDTQLAKKLSVEKGIGIAKILQEQLTGGFWAENLK